MLFAILRRRVAFLQLAVFACLALLPCTLRAQELSGDDFVSLQLVARYPLPLDGGLPLDVRWAGPDSIFVAYETAGVFEHTLTEGLPSRRQVVPGIETLRFAPRVDTLYNLAVSDEHMLVSALSHRVAWRRRASGGAAGDVRTKPLSGQFHDVDLDGDRVLLLGFPTLDEARRSPGAYVWMGDLGTDLDRWRVLHEDDELAEEPRRSTLRLAAVGSVRFLDDGGFVVAPGFLDGVHLFSPTGKLKESWTTRQLSLRAGNEETERLPEDFAVDDQESYDRWLAQSTIDELLDLAGHPAVVVRSAGTASAPWSLVVLDDPLRRYSIPVRSLSRLVRLRGDVDEDGRIVLVATARGFTGETRMTASEVLVLKLPADD